MYFQCDEDVRNKTVYLEVTYLDVGNGNFSVQYNSTSQDYQSHSEGYGRYLVDSREERTAALQALRAGIRDQTDELAALRENERHLQSLLDAVVEASRELQQSGRGDPFASRKGQLPWPLHGAIQNAFGSRDRRTGLVRKGLLIQANDGAPVHAIHRGHVLFADWVRGVGLLIIIDHDQGFLSLYAHNQTLLKSAGDWVEAGETIAAAGNTGGQREANLYFEIRRDGKPVDPVAWLQSRR